MRVGSGREHERSGGAGDVRNGTGLLLRCSLTHYANTVWH
jgi:hypothetical protein